MAKQIMLNQTHLLTGLANWGGFLEALARNEQPANLPVEAWNAAMEAKRRAKAFNGWFDEEQVNAALMAWAQALTPKNLEKWVDQPMAAQPKTVALVLAGNLPLVGLHDVLSVWVSGHRALVKLSSDDKELFPALAAVLFLWVPVLNDYLRFTAGQMHNFQAVIATGSNNSARYFEHYFGAYPHIIRKNRTSVAVLTGQETADELTALGEDLFRYYGLGCRNVTHVLIPQDFDLNRIFGVILPWDRMMENNKYHNNYTYQRSVFMLNKVPFLENGFVLFRENPVLGAPVATVNYLRYSSDAEVDAFLNANADSLQCIVGKGRGLEFGQTQHPRLWDYADGINTLEFLRNI